MSTTQQTPSPIRLMIATPSIDGKYTDEYLDSVIRLNTAAQNRGIGVNVRRLKGHSLIPVGRTILLRDFIQTDATHILFWDSDIGAHPEVVFDLLAADEPFIGAVCVQKRYNWDNIALAAQRMLQQQPELRERHNTNSADMAKVLPLAGGVFTFSTYDDGINVDVSQKQAIEVRYVGCGLTLIKREVIEAMARRYQNFTVVLDNNGDFPALCAQMIVKRSDGRRDWLSEDYALAARAREIGYKVKLAWWTRTTHTGSHTFESDIVTAGDLLGGVTQVDG